jgi:hypothetical protein
MASRSNVQIHVHTIGDIVLDQVVNCAENPAATSEVDVLTFSNGGHQVLPPIAPGYIVTGVLILPPSNNAGQIVLKSILEDNGIILHPTNPTFISLGQPLAPSPLYIDYAGTGSIVVKFIWV